MSAPDPISTSIEHLDGVAVLTVGGEVDLSTAPAFEAAIAEALAEEPAVLVIELSGMEFLASAGVRVLAAAREKLGDSGQLVVVANSPVTKRPIELLGLDKTVALYPTLDDALAATRTSAEE
ncbi:STAS domain-containing protein [Mycobacterium branderi]|uniref:Anti-sigma factor antagonist n=1 Tax=Mycobacterium branderi TaxID=43348 RepID=A0AA91LTT4_9MYCO|nr:STAS domain-containing protein [Mycobacterium branderi]MCV7234817.1 STAS domain-containing protein [Mycobacterium branderi]ORA33592.1 anti-anti-sigma factor [Mycobacterium branderi]